MPFRVFNQSDTPTSVLIFPKVDGCVRMIVTARGRSNEIKKTFCPPYFS